MKAEGNGRTVFVHSGPESSLTYDRELYGKLVQALIELCRHDGNEASSILSVALSGINTQLSAMQAKISKGESVDSLMENIQNALNEVMNGFMQLQFFDRVSQRLDHAKTAIDYMQSPDQLMKTPIESDFTMEDERVLYDALRDGADVNQAVETATTQLEDTLDKSDGDNIELF